MKIKIAFLVLCFLSSGVMSQKYRVADIYSDLLQDAHSVVRNDKLIFTVNDKGTYTAITEYAVTVLNETAAEQNSTVSIPYNKLSKIKNIEGRIYDAAGKEIYKLKSSDIKEVGASAYQDDISDSRVKIVSFDRRNLTLPYTIEYSYEETSNNLMFYPDWVSTDEEHTSVQQSSLTINVPDNLSFRYKEIGLPTDVKKSVTRNGKSITWEVKNQPPIKKEAFSKAEFAPTIMTAPVEFSIQGYDGSFKTWADFAQFYLKLNEGRDVLPPATVEKVKSLTAGLTNTEDKVKALYDYLQSQTHYLNISLGIGGWQSLPAEVVAAKGYGDCKALTNYFNAMLKVAGVTAYPALIYAGDNVIEHNEDFPSSQFNHVLSCVPMPHDTLWLECTSQTNPFNYQGNFTGNRHALLVKPSGGQLVKTTHYLPEDNCQNRQAKVIVDSEGNATAEVQTVYTGIQSETPSYAINAFTQDEQRRWLLKRINLSNFELNNFALKEDKSGVLPSVTEKISVNIRSFANKSGKRLFISPNLMTTFFSTIANEENRVSELYLNENTYSFIDADTITYTLPDGYVVENLPSPISFSESFGTYEVHIETAKNQLIYYRTVKMNGGTYPKETYERFAEFLKKVSKSDRMRVVYVEKKT